MGTDCFSSIERILFIATTFIQAGWSWGDANQGPVFIQEPPHRADFSNTTGISVLCSAHGNPPPVIDWILADGSTVRDIPGLRKILPNGTLVFVPFPAEEYNSNVHSTIYRCVASNGVGTIVSRQVHVRAVVKQYYEVQVYDEFVILGNTAVLKCHIPSFVREYVVVTSWLRGSEEVIVTDIESGGRYSVFPSGELHIRHVTHADGIQPYRCETRHQLTNEQRLSVVSGRVIVSDPQSSVQPRVTDSRSLIQARQKDSVELPCAAQGFPLPTYTWYRIQSGKSIPMQTAERAKQVGGSLFLTSATVEDSGRYTCVLNNSVGTERIYTTLTVTAPLSAYISPQVQTVDVGRAAYLNCTTEGYPQKHVSWLKDGKPIEVSPRVKMLDSQVLKIDSVQREDKGMYQCVVSNDEETAQGTAQLKLGDAAPIFLSTFSSQTLQPGPPFSSRCVASGNPPPAVTWLLDGAPLPQDPRVAVSNRVDTDSVISYVNITSLRLEDGGVYECVATNQVGVERHAAKINIYGPPYIKPMADKSVVAGKDASFDCHVSGYPISEVRWEKEGHTLPGNHRQMVFQNGTLAIKNIQKITDEGGYLCIARNPDGQTARRKLNVQVLVAPGIDPFYFKSNLQRGMRMRVTCVVSNGDFPITIRWLKDGSPVSKDLGVTQKTLDEYSSTLAFGSLDIKHTGNYTCLASNDAATSGHTARLVVNVPPSWLLEPKDSEVSLGKSVALPCAAKSSPAPRIQWKKAAGPSPSPYIDLAHAMSNYRVLPNGTLWIHDARSEDRGYYLCQASNGIGAALSKVLHLTVHVPARFAISSKNVTVTRGEVATLECVAEGDKPITIIWYREGRRFDPARHPRTSLKEENLEQGLKSRLTLRHIHRNDSTAFACQATNAYGSDRTELHLMMQESPEAPRNVRVIHYSSRTVNLTWDAPYDGNSPITSYIVQYKNASVPWQGNLPHITIDGDQISAKITGLRPAHTYHLRVMAQNSVGVSNSSEVVGINTTEEKPGGPPTDVRVKVLGSETLHVTWKPPDRQLLHGEILGYYVGYRVTNSTDRFLYASVDVIPGMLQTMLTNLKKFTEYMIFVQAHNRAGAGPRSQEVTATTDEDVPSGPPTQVQCTTSSSSSLLVLWSPPPVDQLNGILQGYRVVYRPQEEWDDFTPPFEKTTHGVKLQLFELDAYQNYSIEVRAYTRKGDGASSRPIFCRTKEDVPGQPWDIKALIMDSETILLSWLLPRKPNGRIIGYKVYVRSLEGLALDKDVFELPPEQTYYTITHLRLHHRYEFWVTAFTNIGEGSPSHRVVQAPSNKVPAHVASFGSKVIAVWKEEVKLPCMVVGHPTPERRWKKKGVIIRESNRIQFTREGALHIASIQSTDAGNYTCSAENIFDKDEIVYTLIVKVPPVPPMFFVSTTTISSMTLKWKQSNTPGSTIQGYYLHYKREFGEWEKLKLPAENTSYTLDGLLCGTKYQLYLNAFNQLGMGNPTDVIPTRTQGSSPIAPKKEDLIKVNSTSISLNLASWQDGGCPITSFVVEYKLHLDSDWKLVLNNLKFEQAEFLVLDLNPETWYTLRMTAHNSAGSTVANYDFITLTYSGATIAPELIVHSGYGRSSFYSEIGIIIPIVAGIVILIVAGVGVFLYLKRKKEMFPANKYGEKAAGTDVALETALMSEIEKKSCGMSGCPPNLRESNYLPTPVRVSLGHQEDISPYATFRLPAPGMEPPTGPGPGPDLPPTQHSTQHCDKLQLATSYGSCADSMYTKIRKKPQYQNEGNDRNPGNQSSSITSMSSNHEELAKAFENNHKIVAAQSSLSSGRHNILVAHSTSDHTTDTENADPILCNFSPSSLNTLNTRISSYLKPEPGYQCVRDMLVARRSRTESSTSLEGSSDEGRKRQSRPQPIYGYARPIRVPSCYFSSAESNSEDAAYAWQHGLVITQNHEPPEVSEAECDQGLIDPNKDFPDCDYKVHTQYLSNPTGHPTLLISEIENRTRAPHPWEYSIF